MGRIHRIGQDRDVYVFNFVATDSQAGNPVIEGASCMGGWRRSTR
jgi:hypothetical protein